VRLKLERKEEDQQERYHNEFHNHHQSRNFHQIFEKLLLDFHIFYFVIPATRLQRQQSVLRGGQEAGIYFL